MTGPGPGRLAIAIVNYMEIPNKRQNKAQYHYRVSKDLKTASK